MAEHSEVVRRFVEALDLSEVTAVVQDWGGPIGMGAAVADPDRYAGFVIGNTYAWPNLSPDKALLSGSWATACWAGCSTSGSTTSWAR